LLRLTFLLSPFSFFLPRREAEGAYLDFDFSFFFEFLSLFTGRFFIPFFFPFSATVLLHL